MNPAGMRRWARRAGWTALGALAIYCVFLAGMFVIMCQPPQRFGQIMAYFPMSAMSIVPFEPMWNVGVEAGRVSGTRHRTLRSRLSTTRRGSLFHLSGENNRLCSCSGATHDRHSGGRCPPRTDNGSITRTE